MARLSVRLFSRCLYVGVAHDRWNPWAACAMMEAPAARRERRPAPAAVATVAPLQGVNRLLGRKPHRQQCLLLLASSVNAPRYHDMQD